MDSLTPNAPDLSGTADKSLARRELRVANSRSHILLTGGKAAVCAQVRAAIGDDFHVLAVPDGRRALNALRCLRSVLLVVAGDDLLTMDATALFARLAAEQEMATRHTYVYLTTETHCFHPTFAWHLELLRVAVVHVPAAPQSLLDQVECAARHARLRGLVALDSPTRGPRRSADPSALDG